MKDLIEITNLPEPFEKGTSDIWVDPEREDFILESHLDDRIDGASKDADFIEDSVHFISSLARVEEYPSLLDLGCGPGLYAEKFSALGYKVTGIDIAENSIKYAKKQAELKNLPISYHCADFLKFDMENEFDIALLIYQIYGLLDPVERQQLLQNVYRGLKPGGLMLFDVLSDIGYDELEEVQVWSQSRSNSPLSPKKHLGLLSLVKYPNKVSLQKTVLVFPDGELVNYNYWNQYFNIQDLKQDAAQAGLELIEVYSDVNGEPYSSESEFIAVLLRKPLNQ